MIKKYKKFYEEGDWQEAYELQKEIFELTSVFPTEEKFGLVNQMNKSTNSVVANIAEAHGRFYFMDKVRVLYIVRGEIEETQSHIIVSQSRDYVHKERAVKLISKYENLKKKINGKISDFVNKNNKNKEK
ncbi:MAG: four helix bundle protein [Candidatus Magasanikbacteria bacterium]